MEKVSSLLFIIVPAILLPFILMKSGMMLHQKALAVNATFAFVSDYNTFTPSLLDAVMDVFRTIFDRSKLNGPLWTMSHQLIGSLVISIVAHYAISTEQKAWQRKKLYILVFIPLVYLDYYLAGFVFGALVYESLYSLGDDQTIIGRITRAVGENKLWKTVILVLGLYFACITCTPFTGIYKWLTLLQRANTVIRAMGVAVVLFVIMTTAPLQRMVHNGIMNRIGGLSAYIYAFHWPIMLSLGSGVYMLVASWLPYTITSMIVLVVCFAVTYYLAKLYKLFEKSIRQFALNMKWRKR